MALPESVQKYGWTWGLTVSALIAAIGFATGSAAPRTIETPAEIHARDEVRTAQEKIKAAEEVAENLRWKNLDTSLAQILKTVEESRADVRQLRADLGSLDQRVDSLETSGQVNSDFRTRTERELERLRSMVDSP